MNDKFQELYKYLSENNLTDLDSNSFYEKYSGGDSFNELYGYLTSEGMTDLDASSFQSEYFGKKKDEAISEDLSTPQEQPTQPSVESGTVDPLDQATKPYQDSKESTVKVVEPSQVENIQLEYDAVKERMSTNNQTLINASEWISRNEEAIISGTADQETIAKYNAAVSGYNELLREQKNLFNTYGDINQWAQSKLLEKKRMDNEASSIADEALFSVNPQAYLGGKFYSALKGFRDKFVIPSATSVYAQFFTPMSDEEIESRVASLPKDAQDEVRKALQVEQGKAAEIKTNAMKLAMAASERATETNRLANIPETFTEIDNPLEAINYTINVLTETAGQIPLTVLTGGTSSMIIASGLMYEEAVQQEMVRLMEQEGLSKDEALAKAIKDENINKLALNAGATAVAALDFAGAKGIMGGLSNSASKGLIKDFVKRNVVKNVLKKTAPTAIEVGTEIAQEGIEAGSISSATGGSFAEGVSELTVEEMMEVGVRTMLGAGGVNVLTSINNESFDSKVLKAVDSDSDLKSFAFEYIENKAKNGDITPERATELRAKLDRDLASFSKLKNNIPESNMDEAVQLQNDYEAVVSQMSENSALKPFLSQKKKEIEEKMVGLMSTEETKTEIDEETVQEEPMLEGVSNDRNEEEGGQESPELRKESQQEEVTPSETETITQESGAETTQERNQNVETATAVEQEVTPQKEKKKPVRVLSESEGLTDKQYAKQGVTELVDAINQKSRDKLNAATESFKSKVDKIKSDFKEFKDRKKAIISFADELTKELSKSGVKKMPTAKVRTAIRSLNTSTTDAALNKASNKLISIYQGIAVTDAEIKEAAAVNKAKTRVKNRSKKAQYGKFSPVINELASIDESQLEPNQRTEYKSLIQEIANKEYSNINEIAKRASELIDSFIPEQSQPFSEEEISDSDTKKQEKIEEAIAEITSSRFQVPSGTELSAEEMSILKELNSITKEELDNMPNNHVLNILGAKRDISTGVIQTNAQKAKEQIKRYRAKKSIADATNRADFKSNIKQFFLNPKRFFGSKDKTAVSSAAAHTIDSSLGIKGSAFSRFLAPLNEGFAKVERDVNEARGTLSRLYRNVSWTRDKKRIADTKVFMYAIQKQFEDSPNSNIVHSLEEFYEATLGNQGLRANYDKEVGAKSREIVDDLYSKYSSSGAITSDMIWEDMSKEEKRLYEIMRAELDKNAERVYKIKSLDRSEMFNAISSYFSYPVIGYVAVDLDSVLEGGSFASFLSTKAGTTKERVTYANPVHFSASKSFLTSVQDVARDYHLGEALRVENGALKDYKAEFANSDIAQFTNDIADAINEQRKLLIVGSRVGSLSRVANEIQAATYKYLLGSLRRGFTEIATNTIRILNRAILNWDFKIIPSTLKFMLPSKYTATENEAIKVIAPSGMNRYIEGSTTAGYGDVYINMGENADLDFSDRGIEKRIGSGLKTLTWFNSKIAEFGLGKADRLFAKGMYMSELSKNFKKITGEEIDIEAIANQDTQYLEENGEAIAEASRIANDEVGDWFSTTNKAERPLKQLQATQSNSPFARLRYFMLNFLLNEGQALQKAIINKGAVGAIQKGIPIIVGMASYQALMEASSIAFAKLLKLGFDDEEDDEDDRLIMDAIAEDKAIQRGFGSALIELIVARHFNGVARVPLNFFIEKGNEKFGEGVFREEGEEYDPFHSLVYNRMSTTGEIESDQIVSVLAPEFAPIYTGVVDLIESYKEPAEPKSVNAFIRQIMNEDKKEYYKTKAWLTTGAAVGIIPRDIRDSYVYYRNRELIINGEKEMGKRK